MCKVLLKKHISSLVISNIFIYNILGKNCKCGKCSCSKKNRNENNLKSSENNENNDEHNDDNDDNHKKPEEHKDNNDEELKKKIEEAKKKADELDNLKNNYIKNISTTKTTLSTFNNKYYDLKTDITFDDNIINGLTQENKDNIKTQIDDFKNSVDNFIKTIVNKLVENLKEIKTKFENIKNDPSKKFIIQGITIDIKEENIENCKNEDINTYYNKLKVLEVCLCGDFNKIKQHYEEEYKKINPELITYLNIEEITNKYNELKKEIDDFNNISKFNTLSKAYEEFSKSINKVISENNETKNNKINSYKLNISKLLYEENAFLGIIQIDLTKLEKDYSTLESKIELNSNKKYLDDLDKKIKDLESIYVNKSEEFKKQINEIRIKLINAYSEIINTKNDIFNPLKDVENKDFPIFIDTLQNEIDKYKNNIKSSYNFTEEELIFSLPIYQCFDNKITKEDLNGKSYTADDFKPENFKNNVFEKEKNEKYIIKKLDDLDIYYKIFELFNKILKYGDYKYCKDKNLKQYKTEEDKPKSQNYFGKFYILDFDYYDKTEKSSKIVNQDKIKNSLKNFTQDIKTKIKNLIKDYIDIFKELKDLIIDTYIFEERKKINISENLEDNLEVMCDLLTSIGKLLDTNLLDKNIISKIQNNINKLNEENNNIGEYIYDFKLDIIYTYIIFNGYIKDILQLSDFCKGNKFFYSIESYKFCNEIIKKLKDIRDSKKSNFNDFILKEFEFFKNNSNKEKLKTYEYMNNYYSKIHEFFGTSFTDNKVKYNGENYDVKVDDKNYLKKYDCYENCEDYEKQLKSVLHDYEHSFYLTLTYFINSCNISDMFFGYSYSSNFPIQALAVFLHFFEEKEKEKGEKK